MFYVVCKEDFMEQVLHKGQILEWKVPCPNQVLIVYVVVNLNLNIFGWSETYMNSISVLHNGPNSIATSAFSIWTIKKFALERANFGATKQKNQGAMASKGFKYVLWPIVYW